MFHFKEVHAYIFNVFFCVVAPKVNPAILSLAMQQRLEKLRLKQGIPPQFAPQVIENTKLERVVP